MEIIWEDEKREEKPLTLADIEIGEQFKFLDSPVIYRRVIFDAGYGDFTQSSFYLEESTARISQAYKTDGYYPKVTRVGDAPKPKPVTLGELEVGDHFRFVGPFAFDQPHGLQRVIAYRPDQGHEFVPTFDEQTSATCGWFAESEVIPIGDVRLVVPGR